MSAPMRKILLASLMALSAASSVRADDFAAPTGEVLLTIKGQITSTNSDGQLLLDQQHLASLPQTIYTTSTTWTSGTPTFQGVLLKDLVAATRATGGSIILTAANDYSVTMPLADVTDEAPLLAYLMDGKTMSLRDKGPIWMIYPYDSDEAYRTEETYYRSIWQLIEIEFVE